LSQLTNAAMAAGRDLESLRGWRAWTYLRGGPMATCGNWERLKVQVAPQALFAHRCITKDFGCASTSLAHARQMATLARQLPLALR
jgi:hypothetical protein